MINDEANYEHKDVDILLIINNLLKKWEQCHKDMEELKIFTNEIMASLYNDYLQKYNNLLLAKAYPDAAAFMDICDFLSHDRRDISVGLVIIIDGLQCLKRNYESWGTDLTDLIEKNLIEKKQEEVKNDK